jgi:hypothetical protein
MDAQTERPEPDFSTLNRDEIAAELRKVAVIPLWPDAAAILRRTRSEAYKGAKRGQIRTVRFGRKISVPTRWLERELGLNEDGEQR